MAVLNNWSPPRVSQLLVDADLVIPAAYELCANKIKPSTSAYITAYDTDGISVCSFRAIGIVMETPKTIHLDVVRERTAGHSVTFINGIKTDSIDDNGAGAIDILESVALAAGKSASVDSLLTDGISERTGSANISLNSKVLVDHIGEKTASHDIVFDDDIQAQEDFEAKLTQDYLSAHDGTVVRWTSASEETAVNPGLSPGVVIKTVTVPAEYADPNCSFRVLYSHKTTSAIQGRCRVAINGIPVGAGIISDTTYTDSSEVVTGVTAGDTIDIMCWSESGSDLTAYVKDFVVKSEDSIYHPVGASPTWT